MNLHDIYNHNYLGQRAITAVRESIEQLSNEPSIRDAFVDDALRSFEANGAPLEFIDELYLRSSHQL